MRFFPATLDRLLGFAHYCSGILFRKKNPDFLTYKLVQTSRILQKKLNWPLNLLKNFMTGYLMAMVTILLANLVEHIWRWKIFPF